MTITDRPPAERAAIVRALLARLDDYLATDSLYLPVLVETGGRREPATLTLGIVLDAVDSLDAEAPALAAPLRGELDALVALRRGAYVDKLQRELRSAVALWRAAADDLDRDPGRDVEGWRDAARQRTRAAELAAELERLGTAPAPATAQALAAADATIRAHTVPGSGPARGADAARWPAERAWWLWRAPRGR